MNLGDLKKQIHELEAQGATDTTDIKIPLALSFTEDSVTSEVVDVFALELGFNSSSNEIILEVVV
jgi:hypothetical protein